MHRISLLYFIGLVAQASAIVVQDYATAENPPAGLNWSYVYNYMGSSAVSVGGGWLLTAAHVADDGPQPPSPYSLSIGGTVYNQQEIVEHGDRVDLAMVRFDKAFPGHYALFTDPHPNSLVGLEVLLVGFGNTGTVSTDHYTDSGAGKGTQRWGSQRIDRAYKTIYSDGSGRSFECAGFEMGFDLGNTDHEAGVAVGDSGGGTFHYDDDGVWKLTGINTLSLSGTGSWAVSMPFYADWIIETIPEPATLELMSLSTMGLFITRSRQRRKKGLQTTLILYRREYVCDAYGVLHARESEKLKWLYSDCLSGIGRMIDPLRAFISDMYSRYERLNRELWNHLVNALEWVIPRKEAVASRVTSVLSGGMDAFLDYISRERRVNALAKGRNLITSSLKEGFVLGLDAFLEKISWDQKFAAYMRRKSAIRSEFGRHY